MIMMLLLLLGITRYRDFTSGTLWQCDNRAGKMGRCVGLHRAENEL